MEINSNKHVIKYMNEFAMNTGLANPDRTPIRYLWTDSFAVCNYIELYKQTNEYQYLDLAHRLVDQVHHVLGKYRGDQTNKGWISGLDDKSAENHPTSGGLRIGKQFNERSPQVAFNEDKEWDMDGQYYHYITKWIHALNNISKASNNSKYAKWAYELLKTAHKAFTYVPFRGAPMRMYWKMSIDLKRPLVASMGQHDPLDGFITYKETENTAYNFASIHKPNLNKEINEVKLMCESMDMKTADPLGIGGILSDSALVSQLMVNGSIKKPEFLENLLLSAFKSLRSYLAGRPTELKADYRLAFRELGLSIGLKGLEIINKCLKKEPEIFNDGSKKIIEQIDNYSGVAGIIEGFWMDTENQDTNNWKDHLDINTVMLATSLAPEGFLII
jgi:hypothetical protein